MRQGLLMKALSKSFEDKVCLKGFEMAEWTGLEPATPGVTGRYSNQLNYHSAVVCIVHH